MILSASSRTLNSAKMSWSIPKNQPKQTNKQTKRDNQTGAIAVQCWTQEPHRRVKVLPIYVRKSHTSQKHTHIAKTHQQKNEMTTTVSQSAVCALSNQMGARGTEGSPAEMPNLLYTCKWSQIYCTSDEECVCCLWLCVGILRFAKISGLTWRRDIFEKEHIWLVAGG